MESGQQRFNLAKLRDSDLPLKENWQEVLGLDVYDITGEQIGSVEDLYVNRDPRQQRFLVEPRFLVVSAGGLLEVGKKHFLIPVEKISREVVKNRVRVWVSVHREKVLNSPEFDVDLGVGDPNLQRAIEAYYGHR